MTVDSPATTALIRKAKTALASAEALVALGDVDGAVNRACYAMFDAARAAPLAVDGGMDPSVARTHGGLIAIFGQRLVKGGHVRPEMGRWLNRAHEIRLVADYGGEAVQPEDAHTLIGQAATFVEAMAALLESRAA